MQLAYQMQVARELMMGSNQSLFIGGVGNFGKGKKGKVVCIEGGEVVRGDDEMHIGVAGGRARRRPRCQRG